MYTDVVNLFRDIAAEVNPTGTFYHGRVSDANLLIETKPFPQIHSYPFDIALQNDSSAVDIVNNVLVAFIFQDTPNTSDEDRILIIEQADKMQRLFKTWLDSYGTQYTNYLAKPYFKQFNGITSGMFVTFNLQMKNNSCD